MTTSFRDLMTADRETARTVIEGATADEREAMIVEMLGVMEEFVADFTEFNNKLEAAAGEAREIMRRFPAPKEKG